MEKGCVRAEAGKGHVGRALVDGRGVSARVDDRSALFP